ncbi:putative endonuclease lcl3 [Dispira simplex]|nr:putative endonuclease lcl3 [Dispira simplex]
MGTRPYPFYITLVAFTGAVGVAVYRGLRRFPTVDYIPPRWIEQHRPLRGYVVRISDSDNFRLYHAPPLWFGKIPSLHREYMKRTIHIRLAGVDAPESKFFSMPGQPYAAEAKAWVTKLLKNKKVTVVPYAKDRYNRLLGMVYVRSRLFFKVNVSLRMVEAGYATVYKQHGAEYGGILEQLQSAESLAR